MDRTRQHVKLWDGRQLGFAEFGASRGQPVFYFHGWPSSRLEAEAVERLVMQHGVRVIAIDRPGYGLSDFKPGRTIAEWPTDVCEAADRLGIERFNVLGVSGGGPYAAACAAKIPHRLNRVTMVCSLAPLDGLAGTRGMAAGNRWFLHLARTAPRLAQILGEICLERMRRRAGLIFLPQIEAGLPDCDKHSLAAPSLRDALTKSSAEAFRSGVKGPAWDGCLYGRPWGFRLEDIRIPVRLWHGEEDIIVPAAMGRRCAASIPACEATFCSGEGHFSLPFNRIAEIMATNGS
jgi:pimeloyl-ACP methyl ester carboxylesterase